MAKRKAGLEHGRFFGTKKSKVVGCVFDSVGDFVAEASRPAHPERVKDVHSDRASREGDDEWAGGTFDNACKLATDGWPEGAKRAKGLAEVMEGQLGMALQPTFDPHYAVAGVEPDVALYCANEPECMVDYQLVERARAGRLVRVFVDLAASFGMNETVLARRAALVTAFCLACHEQGDTVEVWVGQTSTGYQGDGPNQIFGTAVRAQGAGELFDEDKLAFMLGHPSVLRRLVFGIDEQMPVWAQLSLGAYPGGGYGKPTTDIKQTKQFLKAHVEGLSGEFDVVIPSLNTGLHYTDEHGEERTISLQDANAKCEEWIKYQLRECGYEVETTTPEGGE